MVKSLKNESGVVLVTVIVMTLVMMIFAAGILGLNVSQVTVGEREVERIQAQELALGAWWQNYSTLYAGGEPDGSTFIEPMDGKNFTVITTKTSDDGTTREYDVAVTYPQD